jgi:hypothetical protein
VLDLLALFAAFQRPELALDLVDLLVRAILEIDEAVARHLHAAKQFVQLEVKGPGVAILRVLNQCFIVSWALQAWTGWVKFAAEQHQHDQIPSVFGTDGYIWEFAAATFENWQSEFLQLLSMEVLTAFLIHRGSAESKDSNDRLEAKVDSLQEAIDRLSSDQKPAEREQEGA